VALARERAVSAEMVERGVGVSVMVGVALKVDSGVGVRNSMIVGVGEGVTVVFCFSKVWVISRICCFSCWDWENRKTAATMATPAISRIIMVMNAPKEEPPLGTIVAGISTGAGGRSGSSGDWTTVSWTGEDAVS